MSTYAQQLAALGLTPDVVAQHLTANEMQRFRNLEHAAYGREYEAEQMADHPETFPAYADCRGT